MGKASKITVGYKYYMGIFMGMFRGPVNAITRIKVGDRVAWEGSLEDNAVMNINQPELFGGTKAEGGIDGRFELYMGGPTQTISQALKSMLGGRQPEYRGVVTAFFDGMVCAMSPYPKTWSFHGWRTTAGWEGDPWYPEKCTIMMTGYTSEGVAKEIHAMNPAHILYECQTNVAWGRGLDRSFIDDASFRRAADALYAEGFGLCMRWTRKDTLLAFIQTILDHIGAVVFVSKRTGKLEIKLIRDDYASGDLPIFDSNSGLVSITEATNASPASLSNEVVVTYHSPVTGSDQDVRCHNLAQIQNQECLNSISSTYAGLPTGALAMRVAQRDLRVLSTDLRRFTLVCDRRAWSLTPGDVIKIRDPEQRGIGEVVVRISTTKDGTLTDGKIEIVALQDRFSLPLNTFTQVQPPAGYKPEVTPKLARRIVYEMPWVDMVQQLPQGELSALQDTQSYINSQAEKPTPMSAAYDMAIRVDGDAGFDVRGNGDFGALGALTSDIGYFDTQLVLADMDATMWSEVTIGSAARIARPSMDGQRLPMEICEEFVRIDDIRGNIVTVSRGVMDTRPFRHQAGELLWVTTLDGGTDWQLYGGTEGMGIKIMPWTLSGGRFPMDETPVDRLDLDFRHPRPYPPGAVTHTLASVATPFPWYEPSSLTYTADAGDKPDTFYLHWAHRDRIMQADKLIPHGEGSIGPEPGTTYIVRVYNPDGEVVKEYRGIDGESWAWPYVQAEEDLAVEEGTDDPVLATLRLTSVRDGYESWEYYETKVSVFKRPVQKIYDASTVHQVVQPFNKDSSGEEYTDIGGPAVASLMHQVVQGDADSSDADSMSGANVAFLPHQVTQKSYVPTPLDALLYETPYIQLKRDGVDTDEPKVSSYVARSSDRTVDGYTLFTKHEEDEQYTSAGAQPWTPWGLTAEGIGFFTETITFGDTSDKDGVPIAPAEPGDLILIDQEIMLVKSVSDRTLTVGRGAADTIPAQHFKKRPAWLISTGKGYSNMAFGNEEIAVVKVRPDTSEGEIPLDKLPVRQLQMQYRAQRPYPPGLMMIGGEPFFNTASALADDFDPYTNLTAKDVSVTYAHRNRISQDTTARDHFTVGLSAETGTYYRVRVGYAYLAAGNNVAFRLLNEFNTSEESFTLSAADLQKWGRTAGLAQNAGGYSTLSVTVNAMRDGMINWQGYAMTVFVPSYPLTAGDKPGGEPGPWTPGGNTGGTTPPVEPPDRPDPENPGSEEGSGTDEPDPPSPPVDPEDPDTDPPEPIVPPIDEDNVQGWSIYWDHGWALSLPDTSYKGDNE